MKNSIHKLKLLFSRVSSRNTVSLFALLVLLLALPLTVFLVRQQQELRQRAVVKSGPDLDVTYIARTPRYYRYCVSYPNGIPTLTPCPGQVSDKRWPDIGETVTYTAHIINKGTITTPVADYRWIVNGTVASQGTLPALNPNQETTVQLQNNFPAGPQSIRFEVDPNNTVIEYAEQNNFLNITSHDLTISFWVESGFYDLFNNAQNLVGTYSFEDWVQAHFTKMNERFSQAKYPTAPDGIIDRVRIDKLVVAIDLDGSSSPISNDPDISLIDGRWLLSDGDPTNARGNNGGYLNYLNTFVNSIDWGQNHEITHQLGIIDLYRMGIKNNEPPHYGGVFVIDINGNRIPYNNLNFPVFRNSGLMGGGETSPYNDGTYYESHTAGGMNAHAYKRRGHYGEYLFDTPQTNYIKVVDASGNPIANASVNLYQKDVNTEDIDNTPEHSGTTDAQGVMFIPNRSVNGVTTATGHTLKANPFGQISVVGQNGTMIVKVTKGIAEGYGFYLLHDLNVTYWSGNRDTATMTIRTNYPKVFAAGSNLALNRPVSVSSQVPLDIWGKAKAVDGQTTSGGSSYGWSSDSNLTINHTEWITVDLTSPFNVSQVNLYPRSDIPGLYFPIDFTIQVSNDNLNFTTVISKTNYPRPTATVQAFTFNPIQARYIKVEGSNLRPAAEEGNSYRMQFAEIEVFATTTPTPTPTPSPTPIPTPTSIPTITPTPTPTRTPTPTPSNLPADINRDGCVSILDFNAWLRAMQTGTPFAGTYPDVNQDGRVDILDFNLWLIAMRNGVNLCL